MAKEKSNGNNPHALTKEVDGHTYRRKVDPAKAPFWTPQDETKGHPAVLRGTIIADKVLPAKGKFAERRVLVLKTAEGAIWSVGVGAALAGCLETEDVGEGQGVLIEYTGPIAIEGRKQPMNGFDLWVAE